MTRMQRPIAAAAAFAAAALLAWQAATSRAQEAPPAPAAPRPPAAAPAPAVAPAVNVIVITLDTVRADKLGCYGYFRATTPRLDRFAAECVRFERCLSPIANTTPSHASLFTGVLPYEHGILNNFFLRRPEEQAELGLRTSPTLRTFAQVVAEKGVRTGGFVAAVPVKRSTGLDAGFASWSEPQGPQPRRVGRTVIQDALKFMGKGGDAAATNGPFFCWVHLFDAHGPVRPPTPPQHYLTLFNDDAPLRDWLAARAFPDKTQGEHAGEMTTVEANNLYDGCLRFLDDQLATLLDRLDQPDRRADTAVVIVGDHGHGVGQHDFLSHGPAWDEQLAVPLLVRAPGVAPRVVATPVSTIDVLPTVMELVPSMKDAAFATQCRGRDILAADLEARPLFGQSAQAAPFLAVTTTRWKLFFREDVAPRLYDLEADPHELHDVAAQHADIVEKLTKLVTEQMKRDAARHELHQKGATGPQGAIDPAILEQLKALGYTGDE